MMDLEFDHYAFLGLPSGEEGANLSENEITKAYKKKALELHPDKRPNDCNAHADFQRLKASYLVLKDEKSRKIFDDFMRIKLHEEISRTRAQHANKFASTTSWRTESKGGGSSGLDKEKVFSWKKMVENYSFQQLKELFEKFRAQHANEFASTTSWRTESKGGGSSGLDKEKVLKVYWKKIGENYSAQRLKKLFEKFGEVEDVVKSSKKRGFALVVMASKDAAVAATGCGFGDLSNHLRVVPLDSAKTSAFSSPCKQEEPESKAG